MSESSDHRRDPYPAGEPGEAEPRDDCFGPPDTPVECFCLHCGHIFMSDLLLAVDVDGTVHYACPVKGCSGMGYKFDIFPVNDDDDPDGGWVESEEEEDFEFDEEFAEPESEFDDTLDPDGEIPFDPPHEWSPEDDADEEGAVEEEEEPRYFTRDDYEDLKASGEYDRRAEEIRQWWRQCEADRRTGDAGAVGDTSFREDDIPF